MLKRGIKRTKTERRRRRRGALLVALVLIAVADSATLAGAAVLHARRLERATGTNAVIAPNIEAEHRHGAFSEGAPTA